MRPPKRRRTNPPDDEESELSQDPNDDETKDADKNEEMHDTANAMETQDGISEPAFSKAIAEEEELWFEDGSVVLECEREVFRVHSSILSVNSDIFKDMFAIPQPAESPMFEGVPLIHLPDKVEDMRHFLNALYYRTYFVKGEKIDYESLAALLRMGSKYMVAHLRDDVIEHLTMLYPSSLKKFRERDDDLLGPDVKDVILAVQMGRENDVSIILPAAFYDCCELSIEHILDGDNEGNDEVLRLSDADRRTCLIVRDQLIHKKHTLVDKFLTGLNPSSPCKTRSQCRQSLAHFMKQERDDGRLLKCNIFSRTPLSKLYELTDWFSRLCDQCKEKWKSTEEEAIQAVWDSLPETLGLVKWDELRKLQYGSEDASVDDDSS